VDVITPANKTEKDKDLGKEPSKELKTTTSKRDKSSGIFDVPLDDMKQILVLRPATGAPKWIPLFVYDIVEFIKTGMVLDSVKFVCFDSLFFRTRELSLWSHS
jgi:hypothetical protein